MAGTRPEDLPDPLPYPSASRRALDLLTSRLHEPWSVVRLARSLGVSHRSLHRVVRRELGTPPMRTLRQVRLAEARSRLEAPRPGDTVTRVALDCGFAHLGRFSQGYARQFGEAPSETLRRTRRTVAALAGGIPRMATTAA